MSAKYQKLKELGSGTFGRVWVVRRGETGRQYAMKEVTVSGLSEAERERALTEVAALARCKHVNVIRYKDAFVDTGILNIVMEYADGGDLQGQIQQQTGEPFKQQMIIDWFVQICFALRYIHGLNILHRDLKSQNIFLNSRDNLVKVGDFGIARILQGTQDHASTTIGTPYYLSPEICQQQPYNHKSDMWAAGCVLYELCCLTHPFDAPDFSALVVLILQAKFSPIPQHCGPLLEDLVCVLLRTQPEGRPSAQQVLSIPALQPYVKAYVQKTRTLRDQQATPSPNTAMNERKQLSEQCDENKENIDPCSKSDRAPRKMSWATPKSSPLVAAKRQTNSADSVRKNPSSVCDKVSPSVSLYKEVLQKKKPLDKMDGNVRALGLKEQPTGRNAADNKSLVICGKTYTISRDSVDQVEEQARIKSQDLEEMYRCLYESCTVFSDEVYSNIDSIRAVLEDSLGSTLFHTAHLIVTDCVRRRADFKAVKAKVKDTRVWPWFPLMMHLVQMEHYEQV